MASGYPVNRNGDGEGRVPTSSLPALLHLTEVGMSERQPYSRVYWSIIDDPKFSAIYDDDHHLSAWLRLLLAADQSWPASAHIPAGCQRSSIAALVTAGLIDRAGSRYRVHGLDAERAKRSESGRNAAALRWHSGRNTDGIA